MITRCHPTHLDSLGCKMVPLEKSLTQLYVQSQQVYHMETLFHNKYVTSVSVQSHIINIASDHIFKTNDLLMVILQILRLKCNIADILNCGKKYTKKSCSQ